MCLSTQQILPVKVNYFVNLVYPVFDLHFNLELLASPD